MAKLYQSPLDQLGGAQEAIQWDGTSASIEGIVAMLGGVAITTVGRNGRGLQITRFSKITFFVPFKHWVFKNGGTCDPGNFAAHWRAVA